MELPCPTRLADVLAEIGVPAAEVYLAVINDRVLESTDELIANEDIVRLYPPVNGG